MKQMLLFLFIAIATTYFLLIGFSEVGIATLVDTHSFTIGGVAVLVISWLFIRQRNNWTWHHTPLHILLIPFWIAAIAMSFADNLETWRRSAEALWYIAFYTGVWFCLTDVLANTKSRIQNTLIAGVLFAGFINLILVYAQIILFVLIRDTGGLPRPAGLYSNPNVFASFLLIILPFSLVWAARERGLRRWIAVIYVLLNIVVFVLSFSRGAWVGAFAGLVIYGFLLLADKNMLSWDTLRTWWRKQSAIRQRIVLFAAGSTILLSAGFIALLIRTLSISGRSLSLRTYLWDGAWTMFIEKPLTGYGLNTYGYYLPRFDSIPPGSTHSYPHNIIMSVMAELGLPGLVLFLLTCLIAIWYIYRPQKASSDRLLQRTAMASIAALGVHHLLDMPIIYQSVGLPLLLILAIALLPSISARPITSKIQNRIFSIGVAAIWFAVISVASWHISLYGNYIHMLRTVSATEQPTAALYRQTADDLQAIVNADPYQPTYVAQQADLYGLAAAVDPLDTTALNRAIQGYERFTQLESTHSIGHANLAALYWQAGNSEQALASVDNAIRLAPEWDFYRRMQGIYTGEIRNADTVDPPSPIRWPDGIWFILQFRREVISPNFLPQVGYGT